ncbi:hypothetical protein AT959_12180 [Dechloromonas denitrificans]|uniref:Uncharacterized protein n=1 Tax=Dechloromonas denitrificans TaxID=281362 RepID=A0A133XGV0_9RHOO|nr:hypothetical protein AT959_12180 [Dechloromonas denitrificans]
MSIAGPAQHPCHFFIILDKLRKIIVIDLNVTRLCFNVLQTEMIEYGPNPFFSGNQTLIRY